MVAGVGLEPTTRGMRVRAPVGSKVVAARETQAAKDVQVFEKMEAGVGIEPAFTDLQQAPPLKQQEPS